MAVQLDYRRPDVQDLRCSLQNWRRGSALGFLAAGLFWPVTGLVFLAVLGAPALIVGHIWIVAAAGIALALAATTKAVRLRRAMAVLAYLDQGMRLKLPLPAFLMGAAMQEGGVLGKRLMTLRQLIQDGLPLGKSLVAAVPEMPARWIGLNGAAERMGNLPEAVARLHAAERRASRARAPRSGVERGYPLLMLLVMSLVIAFLMIFVMPKFEAILHDFRLPLPRATVALLSCARDVAGVVPFIAILVALGLLGRIAETIFSGRLNQVSFGQRLCDYAISAVPIARSIARDQALADFCDVMADGIMQGWPADRAAAEAIAAATNAPMERRIRRLAGLLAEGAPLPEAMRKAGMPDLMVGLCSSACGEVALVDVFRFLSQYHRARFHRLAALARGAMLPLSALAFGALVAWIALALFLPMISLINSLAPSGWRM